MPDIESLLTRWQSAGVLDAATAARIRAHEVQTASKDQSDSPAMKWQGITALILGAILLACGVVLFVSAHWDQTRPRRALPARLAPWSPSSTSRAAWRGPSFRGLSTALHAVGTIATGAAIALVGQIFNIQEHWPAAVLLWALAALAGWVLLHDQAQQTLALLLSPPGFFREIGFRSEWLHRRRRLHGSPLLCLGHSLHHIFSRLAPQSCAGNSLRGKRHRRGHRSSDDAVGLDFLVEASRASFPSARAFGPGSPSPPCRSSSPHSTATRASSPLPLPSPFDCAALVLSLLDESHTRSATESTATYIRTDPNLLATR